MMHYTWPGNVRELRNTIEYAMVLCHEGEIESAHLPPKITDFSMDHPQTKAVPDIYQQEREELIDALKQTRGNQSQAAKLLNISRVTFWKRVKKHHILVKRESV